MRFSSLALISKGGLSARCQDYLLWQVVDYPAFKSSRLGVRHCRLRQNKPDNPGNRHHQHKNYETDPNNGRAGGKVPFKREDHSNKRRNH